MSTDPVEAVSRSDGSTLDLWLAWEEVRVPRPWRQEGEPEAAADKATSRLSSADRATLRALTGSDYLEPDTETISILGTTIVRSRVAQLIMAGNEVDNASIAGLLADARLAPGQSSQAFAGQLERALAAMTELKVHNPGEAGSAASPQIVDEYGAEVDPHAASLPAPPRLDIEA